MSEHGRDTELESGTSNLTLDNVQHHDTSMGDDVPSKSKDTDNVSDSDLSEIDEGIFNDYEHPGPSTTSRPVIAIDEETIGKIGVHRRVRDPNAPEEPIKRRDKGRRREKRRREDENEVASMGRSRDGRVKLHRERPERILTEEERKLAELDAKINEAVKGGIKRRKKKDEEDLESFQDDMIIQLREKMLAAARADHEDVASGLAATHKIKLLEDVRKIIFRPNLTVSLLDNGFLNAVKAWLEPLDNKALPAYSIQKDLFKYLSSFHPTVEVLRESGIGKIVAFYTKDIRPQPDIKRQAQALVRDWARPILGRSDDYRTREYKVAKYDPTQSLSQRSREDEDRSIAMGGPAAPVRNVNKARIPMALPRSYDIVPKSTISGLGDKDRGNKADNDLMKRIARNKAIASRKGSRKSGLSIEGRGDFTANMEF